MPINTDGAMIKPSHCLEVVRNGRLCGGAEWLHQEIQRLTDALGQAQGELRIKSEFLSSRQCPDHAGKWQRGECLQCRIEKLEYCLTRLVRLKTHKDEHGKTEYYLENQPLAWSQARSLIAGDTK